MKKKLVETSITKIHLVSLVMNIDKILRDLIFVVGEMWVTISSMSRSRRTLVMTTSLSTWSEFGNGLKGPKVDRMTHIREIQ